MGPRLADDEQASWGGNESEPGEKVESEEASVTSAQSLLAAPLTTAHEPTGSAIGGSGSSSSSTSPHGGQAEGARRTGMAADNKLGEHAAGKTGARSGAVSSRPPVARGQRAQRRSREVGPGQRMDSSGKRSSFAAEARKPKAGADSLTLPAEVAAVGAQPAVARNAPASSSGGATSGLAAKIEPTQAKQKHRRHKHAKRHRKQLAAGVMQPSAVKLATSLPLARAASAKRIVAPSSGITYRNSSSAALSALSSSYSSPTDSAAAPATKAAQPSLPPPPKRLSAHSRHHSSSSSSFGSTQTSSNNNNNKNNNQLKVNHSFNYSASNNKQQKSTKNLLPSTNQHAIKSTTDAGHTQHRTHRANHPQQLQQQHQHFNSSSATNNNNTNRYNSLPLQQSQNLIDTTTLQKQQQKYQKSLYHHFSQHHTRIAKPLIMTDQAVIDKLEAGFAKLQASTPEQCHSLLKKYLTREVLDKLKTHKTAMGATLLDVAQSGFENLDSGVGIYAPDAESYTLFADLFNPIIEDYHGGFKATDKHPASDFGDLDSLVNVDPNNEYVISTRVRCGRSLQGYPFNPCLTEAQYKEMEAKVSSTLKELQGDLAGTYYPLTGMTKETQQQLIDDHFLFKEGDRFLQAANACRYWPTGRGIYHNEAKSFLVWVNEEDHLRIISMQKGGDLKTIFGRLVRGVRSIEAKVPFSRDERLGFLTFCPTNLGTTIRASVHIKLPKLAADRKKLEEVAGRYNLQVRGTSGEHTESIGGIYDISNKRRLGLTEYQAVREMQDGILELIKIEKSL